MNEGLHDALLAKPYINERNDIFYDDDLTPNTGRPDSLAPIPGDKTNMNHWILWFNDYLETVKYHDCDDGYNQIIMFKSCYPISAVNSYGTEPGDPFSGGQTVANYKAVYRKYDGGTYTQNGYTYQPLEDIFASHPEILFIPITAPSLEPCSTNLNDAARARTFNNWLKNDWLTSYNTNNPGLNNVAVYDWFDLLSYHSSHPDYPNLQKIEFRRDCGDSHPNTYANEQSTVDFATGTPNFLDTTWNTFHRTITPNWDISIHPSQQTIPSNTTVEITLIVNLTGTADPVSGWEINQLNYSATHLTLNTITEGNWLNTTGTTMFNPGTINNTQGTITDIYCFTLGENTTTNGTLCTLNFTTKTQGVSQINYDMDLSFEGESITFLSTDAIIQIDKDETDDEPGPENNTPPDFMNPVPENSTEPLTYRTSQIWSITITDDDGDSFTGTIRCHQQTRFINGGNDTYSIYLTDLSAGTHKVFVEVSDGSSWTKKWFHFSIEEKQNEPGDDGNDNPDETETPGLTLLFILTALFIISVLIYKRKNR